MKASFNELLGSDFLQIFRLLEEFKSKFYIS